MIHMTLYDAPGTRDVVRTFFAIKNKSIVFVSRVKLVHLPSSLRKSSYYIK